MEFIAKGAFAAPVDAPSSTTTSYTLPADLFRLLSL